jgi:4-amino-4-deoxy-L-arabinose transferase-like glycosyltransferase
MISPSAPNASSLAEPAVPAGLQIGAIATPWPAVLILIALGALLFLSNLGGYPLYTKGEPREAVTVFNMVHGGGIILPMRAGVEIPSKPLLMHWMAAALSFALGGVTELSVRLPSALLAIAGMVICYLYVRRLFDEKVALLAAVFLGTTFQYLQAGTGSRVDMTLTFFLQVALFEFIAIAEGITSRRMLLYVAIAFAILAKGPVGLVLPLLVALAWILLQGRWRVIPKLSVVRGALVVAVLGGGWYFAAAYVGGMDFVRKQLWSENLERFLGGAGFHEGHVHPFYYLDLALLGGFLPWTVLLPTPLIQAFGRWPKRGPRFAYLLVWAGVVLLFYSFAESKRGVYLLALYPALATLLAVCVADAIATPSEPVRRFVVIVGRLAGITMLFSGIAALVGLAVTIVSPPTMRDFLAFWGITARGFVPALSAAIASRWALAASAPIALEILGVMALRGALSMERLVAAVVGATALGVLAANFIVVPAIANTLSLREFALEMVNTVGSASVGYLGALDYGVAFYSAQTIPIVHLGDPNLPDYLISWETIYARLPEKERALLTVALTSNPTALDGSGAMVLLRRAALPPSPASNSLQVRAKGMGREPKPSRGAGTAQRRDCFDQLGQHFRRAATKADVADRGDFGVVEVHLHHHPTTLLNLQGKSRCGIDGGRSSSHDHEVSFCRMRSALVQHINGNRLTEGNRVGLENAIALRTARRQHA